MARTPRPTASWIPPGLARSDDDRVIAGVAAGVGRWLGVDPIVVRLSLILLTLASGLGVGLYVVVWVVLPEHHGAADMPTERIGRRDTEHAIAFGLLTVGSLLLLRSIGIWFPDGFALADGDRSDRRRDALVWSRAEGADPPIEAGRGVDVEHSDGDRAVVSESVFDARRHEDEGAGRALDLLGLIGKDEGQLAVENVEGVVLGLVEWASSSRPGTISMIAKLNRGVSVVRARNSTFPST